MGSAADVVPVSSPSELRDRAPGERVRAGGRVIAAIDRSIVIADAFATIRVELAADDAVAVFDLVVIEGETSLGGLAGARILERHAPKKPRAGNAASETGRLLRDGVGPSLRARRDAMDAVRGFFASRGFLEVDTPSIVPCPGLDLHLAAFDVPGGGHLITSPEYQMKRLLAGGVHRCFQIARCFRRGEAGSLHEREFVMVEFYRAFAGAEEVMGDTEELVKHVARALGSPDVLRSGDRAADLRGAFDRLPVAQAFARFAGVGAEEAIALAYANEGRFFELLVDRVEPALAASPSPVFLTEYPAPFASLARLSDRDPRVAERFELYAAGVELCNGFGELTDPVEQRARFERDRSERAARGLPAYPLDERFLDALEEGMPPAAGNAIGFDRLLALCLGAPSIASVQPFPAAWI